MIVDQEDEDIRAASAVFRSLVQLVFQSRVITERILEDNRDKRKITETRR